MEPEFKDWWFFVQPSGYLGCYDEVDREIRSFNLTREEIIAESRQMASAESEFYEVNVDHEAALQDAIDGLPPPVVKEAEAGRSRFQIAMDRDLARYGPARIQEHQDSRISGSKEDVNHFLGVLDAFVANVAAMVNRGD